MSTNNLIYLKSKINENKLNRSKSRNNDHDNKQDFIKLNDNFKFQKSSTTKKPKSKAYNKDSEFNLNEAQDDARKSKMALGIDKYYDLKSNNIKPSNDDKDLLQFNDNFTDDSSDDSDSSSDNDDNESEELIESVDEFGRTIFIPKNQSLNYNPLDKRPTKVKGKAIYGDKLQSDWKTYQLTDEQLQNLKNRNNDRHYIRHVDIHKDDNRYKGALYYRFNNDQSKSEQLKELRDLRNQTIRYRSMNELSSNLSYRQKRQKLVSDHIQRLDHTRRSIWGSNVGYYDNADDLISNAINFT